MLNRLFRSLFVLSLFIGCASHPAAPVTSEIPDEYLALPTTDADAFVRALVHSGAPFTGLEVRPTSLEEAFLAITALPQLATV